MLYPRQYSRFWDYKSSQRDSISDKLQLTIGMVGERLAEKQKKVYILEQINIK